MTTTAWFPDFVYVPMRKLSEPLPAFDPQVANTLHHATMNRPPNGATVDMRWGVKRPVCILCANWVCATCWESRKAYVKRNQPQVCNNCGNTEGYFIAVRHFARSRAPLVYDNRHRPPRRVPYTLRKVS